MHATNIIAKTIIFYMYLNSGERILEDFQGHLDKEEDRLADSEDKLERNSRIMVSVKGGVEHLADKLHHLKAVSALSMNSFALSIIIVKMLYDTGVI